MQVPIIVICTQRHQRWPHTCEGARLHSRTTLRPVRVCLWLNVEVFDRSALDCWNGQTVPPTVARSISISTASPTNIVFCCLSPLLRAPLPSIVNTATSPGARFPHLTSVHNNLPRATRSGHNRHSAHRSSGPDRRSRVEHNYQHLPASPNRRCVANLCLHPAPVLRASKLVSLVRGEHQLIEASFDATVTEPAPHHSTY